MMWCTTPMVARPNGDLMLPQCAAHLCIMSWEHDHASKDRVLKMHLAKTTHI